MKYFIVFVALLFELAVSQPAQAQGCATGDLACAQRMISEATAQAQAARYAAQLQATRQAIDLQAQAQATYAAQSATATAQAVSADATRQSHAQAARSTVEADALLRAGQATRQAIEAQATQAAYGVQLAEVQRRSEFGTWMLYFAGGLAACVIIGLAVRLFARKPVKVLHIEADEVIDVPQPLMIAAPKAPAVPQVNVVRRDDDYIQNQILEQWRQ